MQGQHVDRYAVTRVLAVGATSSVLLAHDPDLDVDVAVKVLADHLVHRPEVVAQFLAQARTLRSITDPRVIAVHDIGTTESGQPFFVMDLAAGGTLAERLTRAEPLDVKTRARLAQSIGAELALALDAVHRHDIVHGDVKPENVFVADAADGTPFPAGARLVLGDLGGVDRDGRPLPGTPGYMAPEQRRGESVDARADVYAATALIARVLTGAPPSIDGGVALPSRFARFRRVLDRGLAADPDARPDSIRAWAAMLRSTRHRAAGAIAAAVLAFVILVLAIVLVVGRGTDSAYAVVVAGDLVVQVGAEAHGDSLIDASALGFTPSAAVARGTRDVLVTDPSGNRVMSIVNGTVSPFAGSGTAGDSGDDGPATDAQLNRPRALAAQDDDVFIADSANNRVRLVRDGTIRTVAGNGAPGEKGDGGAATAAAIGNPIALAVLPDRRVLVISAGTHRIRSFTVGGSITTFAGNGNGGYSGDGDAATHASLRSPNALAVDATGRVYVSDAGNGRVRVIDTDGVISTLATLDGEPETLGVVDDVVIVGMTDGTVRRIHANGAVDQFDPS